MRFPVSFSLTHTLIDTGIRPKDVRRCIPSSLPSLCDVSCATRVDERTTTTERTMHQDSEDGVEGQDVCSVTAAATSLEIKHVTRVYNHIAKHFSDTRHTPWPKVCDFLKSLDPGSLVYDIGCGNGKYTAVNPLLHMIGADASFELLTISRCRGMPDAVLSDAKTLPFRSGTADNVISIAVLHHLSTQAGRLGGVREISRVLKPGGSALLTVWAFEQNKNGSASKYVKSSSSPSSSKADASNVMSTPPSSERQPNGKGAPGTLHGDAAAAGLPIHRSRTPFQSQDVLVPWTCKETNETLLRYYHVFVEHELTHLCERIPGIAVIDQFYDEGNWCVVIQRESDSPIHQYSGKGGIRLVDERE